MSANAQALFNKVKTGEFQDEADPRRAALELGRAVASSWQQSEDAQVLAAHQALLRAFNFPEHRSTVFATDAADHIALALARAQLADEEREYEGLLGFVVRNLAQNNADRARTLALLCAGLRLHRASTTLTRLCLQGIHVALDLAPPASSKAAAADLLSQLLMPLHSVQGKVSPTQSLLGTFHQELALCVTKACSVSGSAEVFESVLDDLAASRYPAMSEGNSPKEVLFLHELEGLISNVNIPMTGKARATVCSRLLQCVGSLHAAVCERALQFWKSDTVFNKLQGSDQLLSKTCDRVLAKTSLEHWNQTVKNMAGAALLQSSQKSTKGASSTANEPSVSLAIRNAQERAAKQSAVPETLPLPKAFSSTSVIRDATEPFTYGAFGALWKARAIVPGATKSQWPQILLKELEDPVAAREEAAIMQRIGSHPNLVGFLGMFEMRQGTAASLVLELIDGLGDLHTCIIERGPLSLDACKLVCGEVGAALKHIHAQRIVFGDMKPENILLTKEGHVKLCDFGSAFPTCDTQSSRVVGTVEYMPPEQVSSIEGDWWAFGCVIHYVLTGRPPVFFDSELDADLASAFSRAVTFADQQGGSLLNDANARQIVAALCNRSAGNRPKDGGESLPFFDKFRPWNELHKLKSIPPLPPQRAGVTSKALAGPWQRRTFSTIHSPMPQAYSINATFIDVCMGTCPRPIQNFTLPQNWLSVATQLSQLIEKATNSIPKQRFPAPFDATPTQTGTSNAKKMRRTGPNSYTVAGVDLTAG